MRVRYNTMALWKVIGIPKKPLDGGLFSCWFLGCGWHRPYEAKLIGVLIVSTKSAFKDTGEGFSIHAVDTRF